MRGIIGICLLTAGALAAGQGEQDRSNTLSPKEAAEGWLLLFDGETTFGWTASAPDKLTVKDGVMRFEGPGTLQTTTPFHECALEFHCRVTDAQAHGDVKLTHGGVAVDMATPQDKTSPWGQARLMLAGQNYKFSLQGSAFGGSSSGTTPALEAAPFAFVVKQGVQLELRRLTLLPLGHKPLFNGKNLEGWREFTGKKYVSKFTVNDKLELNVKNGPGDLQTEDKYANFLLQLECISHGKHLNSGIFFRCKPNEYQNGYECQIHNGWTAEAKKDFVVEHYDPKTHELLRKDKVKTAAIDGGTGAIYRRTVARKQVAKDLEWFTLTITANGNHFASWVNGIQVADFTDNRPANANPRNGCRLEAGHISVQGHDKTTDLSFRNIRIAKYP